MSDKRYLIVGSSGQLGHGLQQALKGRGEVVTAARQGADIAVDLTQPDTLVTAVEQSRPDIIFNPAAYTAVDKAEEEVDIARAANGEAPGVLAELAKKYQAQLIHYSTDYVFDGTGDRPYTEDDPVNPLGAYGESKLAGEQAVLAVGGNAFVLRTCWLYSDIGQNFYLTMRRLFAERDELGVVNDQIGCPTWSGYVAEQTARMLEHPEMPDLAGLYHLCAGGQGSWYDLARAILEASGESCHLKPIQTSDYPTPAARPAWSVLDCGRIAATFGLELPDWQAVFADFQARCQA